MHLHHPKCQLQKKIIRSPYVLAGWICLIPICDNQMCASLPIVGV